MVKMIKLRYKGINGMGIKFYDTLQEFMSEVGSFFIYSSEKHKLNYKVLEFIVNGLDVAKPNMTLRELFKMYESRGVNFTMKGAIA